MTTSEFQFEMVCSNYEEVLKSEIKTRDEKVPEMIELQLSEQTINENSTIDNTTAINDETL